MTSDEISATIQSKTGLHSHQHIWRNTPDFHVEKTEKEAKVDEDNLWHSNLFQFFMKKDNLWWRSTDLFFLKNDEWEKHSIQEMKIMFNPFGLNEGVQRWLVLAPKAPITKDLLFSNYGWRNFSFEDFEDFYNQIKADPEPFFKKAYEKPFYHRTAQVRFRPPEPPRERTSTTFNVDLYRTEYGRANYSVRIGYDEVEIDNSDLEEVRRLHQEEGYEDAVQKLEELIYDSVYEQDGEYGDYDYEDHDSEDSERSSDYTDYSELMDSIMEGHQ